MKILVAEDDTISRRMLETMLGRWGFEVVVAKNGNEAWQAVQAPDAPNLAILDWMMPEMDGIEVCRRMRQQSKCNSIYIILLTSRARKEDIVVGLEAGANDYLTKPFDHNELRARIQVGRRIVELQSALETRVRELQEALANIKTLHGLIPICSHCKKIRDDKGYWNRVEVYISQRSNAEFSHGICPTCLEKYYPEMISKREAKGAS